jgi:hypothetical protein
MKKQLAIIAALLLSAARPTMGLAETAAGVDWKLYGSVSDGGERLCFYDAAGVTRNPEGGTRVLMRVWVKCLPQAALEAIDIEKDFDGKIAKNAARKVAEHYVPPLAEVETVDFDQMLETVWREEAANIAGIQPAARIFYELDCSDRRLRELSMEFQAKGKFGYRNTPRREWTPIPPETNGARLLKILCPLQ